MHVDISMLLHFMFDIIQSRFDTQALFLVFLHRAVNAFSSNTKEDENAVTQEEEGTGKRIHAKLRHFVTAI